MPETGRYQNFLPEPEWLVPEDPEKELWKVEPPEDPPLDFVVFFVPFGASTMATFWISPVFLTVNVTSSATS